MENTTDMTKMYREWYHEYQEKAHKASNTLARMTGYFAATAKYGDHIPKRERIGILQYLIKTWRNHEPGELTEMWCKEWEEKIKELEEGLGF